MVDNTSLTNNIQEQQNIPFLVQQLRTDHDNAVLKQTAKLLGAVGAGNSDMGNYFQISQIHRSSKTVKF
ncbi:MULTISPECIES: hypothetical protein [unclassified Microcoleus]|uniref:hypothetical protein n=1 Tax=unclassified Microcoleus TaxID=2642155 RepID=UPI002FD604DA